MKHITVFFDNGFDLHIDLHDNWFVNKWTKLFVEEVAVKPILQTDTFSFFMTEEESKNCLISAVEKVNGFLKTKFIDVPDEASFNNPDYYNHLHLQFEQLAGPDWDQPTKLMVLAPKEIQLAVRHINRFCHRLEIRPYRLEPLLRVEFDTHTRLPLGEKDFNLFTSFDQDDTVYLDYSTLGKGMMELYEDYLSPHYQNAKTQQHYSANFVIRFGQGTERRSREGFVPWMHQHGLDISTMRGIGHIPLGTLRQKNSLDSVTKSRKINKITLE